MSTLKRKSGAGPHQAVLETDSTSRCTEVEQVVQRAHARSASSFLFIWHNIAMANPSASL